MKKALFLLILPLILFGIFSIRSQKYKEESTKPNWKSLRFAGKLVQKSIKETKKKHPVYCVGTGTGGDCLHFSVDYEIKHPLTEDEARAFLFDTRNILIKVMNEGKINNKYYSSHIFDNKSVSITLYIIDQNGKNLFHPEICVGSIRKDGVDFRTNDPENTLRYMTSYHEPLEEADAKNEAYLKKLNTQEK